MTLVGMLNMAPAAMTACMQTPEQIVTAVLLLRQTFGKKLGEEELSRRAAEAAIKEGEGILRHFTTDYQLRLIVADFPASKIPALMRTHKNLFERVDLLSTY